jgi:hypothetical protein
MENIIVGSMFVLVGEKTVIVDTATLLKLPKDQALEVIQIIQDRIDELKKKIYAAEF